MAPAFGVYYKTNGAKGQKPVGSLAQAQRLYDQFRSTVDRKKQVAIGRQLIQLAVQEVTTISTVGLVPVPLIVDTRMQNVPDHYVQDWIIFSPGNLDPCHFYYRA